MINHVPINNRKEGTTMKQLIMKIVTVTVMLLSVAVFSLAAQSDNNSLLTGYIIDVNEDDTMIIDLGKSNGIGLDDEFVIHSGKLDWILTSATIPNNSVDVRDLLRS